MEDITGWVCGLLESLRKASQKIIQKSLLGSADMLGKCLQVNLRLFLHGFVIRESMVELWIFDRSRPYSCGKFDLHEGPDRFIKVMAGYTMMSHEELGLNTYIMLKGKGKTKEQRLYLEEEPIAF